MAAIEKDSLESRSLRTKNLVLRPLVRDDAAAITEHLQDEAIVQNLASVPYPYRLSDAEDFIDLQNSCRETVFAISSRDDPGLLGIISLRWIDRECAEIGYWLGRSHRGKGLTTEAAQAIIDFGFERPDLSMITGNCRVANDGSRMVMTKCGFQWKNMGMLANRYEGREVAVDHFELSRPVWSALKNWAGRR